MAMATPNTVMALMLNATVLCVKWKRMGSIL